MTGLLPAELTFVAIPAGILLLERAPVSRLANHSRWSMLALLFLTIALRLALLPRYPMPAPYVSDDFAQILSADTLLHFRLANPVHPFHRFFETFFTLQQPTYSAMFPLGQGIVLALGKLLTGQCWGGVVLSTGALPALCYWMLRAWVPPGWAFVGGLLTAIQFGPLCEWMNSYWGGAVAACAGCLVFGALPRRKFFLVGFGIAIHSITRPFETVFLLLSVIVYIAYTRAGVAALARMAPPLAAALLLTVLHNYAVTGNWNQLPYQLSQYEYGVPTTFTVQQNPKPHRTLTREQQLTVEIQHTRHGDGDTPATYFQRLAYRFRYLRFFYLAPLYLALPFFLPSLRQLRYVWVVGTIALFVAGSNCYPYFYPHYIAGITCLLVLAAAAGLERMSRLNNQASRWLVRLSGAHFLFWYGVLAFATPQTLDAIKPFATWHVINIGDPEGRIAIRKQLESMPGQHLVFVRYWALHTFREWVHNSADIDSQRIVWARDLGQAEDSKLRAYYPNRNPWILEPDAFPPRLNKLLPDNPKLDGISPRSDEMSPAKSR